MNSRLAEMLDVWDWLEAQLDGWGIDAVVDLGDLWDRKEVIPTVAFNEVYDRIHTAAKKRPHVFQRGNHDAAGGGVRHSLETLRHIPDVIVLGKPAQVNLDNICIYSVPYDDDVDAMKAAMVEAARYARERNASRRALLITHGEMEGAKTGSEFPLKGRFARADLHEDAFDWVLAGHVHEPSDVYVGSFVQRYFSDIGSQRSVIVLDTESPKWERHMLPGPRFEKVAITGPKVLEAYAVNENVYYHVVVTTTKITSKMLAAKFDAAKGWKPSWEAPRETQAPRLTARGRPWTEVVAEYAQQAETELDKARLAALGQEYVRKALEAA